APESREALQVALRTGPLTCEFASGYANPWGGHGAHVRTTGPAGVPAAHGDGAPAGWSPRPTRSTEPRPAGHHDRSPPPGSVRASGSTAASRLGPRRAVRAAQSARPVAASVTP